MSTVCTIALAFGLGLAVCNEPVDDINIGVDDPGVWDYERRDPEVVEVIKEVPVEVVKEVYVDRPIVPEPEAIIEVVEEVPEADVEVSKVDEAWRRFYVQRVNASKGTLRSSNSGGISGSKSVSDFPTDTDIVSSASALERVVCKHPSLSSGVAVDNEDILTTDRYIAGHLETAINTELDGTAIIQTSGDVFGYHGRRKLIPKGSRIECEYTSPKKIGQSRVELNCNRLFIHGHKRKTYEVSGTVSDVQGRVGITGDVDNRFLESYGSASATVRTAVREACEEVSTRCAEITVAILEKLIELRPIINIPQGTRVQVRPADDWIFNTSRE